MKIGYSKTYPILVSGQWEKIWIEDKMTGTEDEVKKRLYDLKRNVENFHYESNKAAEKQKEAVPVEERLAGNLINDMATCKDLKVLESYKMLVKNKPELEQAYLNQYKKLIKLHD